MKAAFIALGVSLCQGCASQSPPPREGSFVDATPVSSDTPGDDGGSVDASPASTTRMRVRVGSSVFTASIAENEAGAAFEAMLPGTFDMHDVNANEKAYDLPRALPANASNPGTVRAGDVMLYGSRTLVLFYESFPTSYSYTRLGRIEDATGLAAALGAGNVTVTFWP